MTYPDLPDPKTERAKRIHARLLELLGWLPNEALLRALAVVLDEELTAEGTHQVQIDMKDVVVS